MCWTIHILDCKTCLACILVYCIQVYYHITLQTPNLLCTCTYCDKQFFIQRCHDDSLSTPGTKGFAGASSACFQLCMYNLSSLRVLGQPLLGDHTCVQSFIKCADKFYGNENFGTIDIMGTMMASTNIYRSDEHWDTPSRLQPTKHLALYRRQWNKSSTVSYAS